MYYFVYVDALFFQVRWPTSTVKHIKSIVCVFAVMLTPLLYLFYPCRCPRCLRRDGLSSQLFLRGQSYRLNVCWSDR